MQDIKKLKVSENQDHILLHIVFDEKFPYSPPFVRVVKPVINGGYVTAGGAICMELLTPQVRGSGLGGGKMGNLTGVVSGGRGRKVTELREDKEDEEKEGTKGMG